MKTVRSYQIDLNKDFIELPNSAKPLFVEAHGRSLILFTEVLTDEELHPRKIVALHTGQASPDNLDYVGSARILDDLGKAVWRHVYLDHVPPLPPMPPKEE